MSHVWWLHNVSDPHYEPQSLSTNPVNTKNDIYTTSAKRRRRWAELENWNLSHLKMCLATTTNDLNWVKSTWAYMCTIWIEDNYANLSRYVNPATYPQI